MKTRIEKEFQLGDVAEQKLMYLFSFPCFSLLKELFNFCSRAGKILKDEQTMAESGVKENDFIVVMVTKVLVDLVSKS